MTERTSTLALKDIVAEVMRLSPASEVRIDVGSIEFFKAVCEREFGPLVKAADHLAINSFSGIPVRANRMIPRTFVAIIENGQIERLLDLRDLEPSP